MNWFSQISILVFLFFQASPSFLTAQAPPPPKREFRAVWVATVSNIDYPKNPTANRIALREQWRQLLKKYKSIGLNAVIVQIRPAGDALYPSELAPWSKFLTGQQGKAPESDFDPLAFMIEEAHLNGMSFHAWLNPYRATVNLDTLSLSQNHMFYRHREWMVRYGNRFYFNPALPEVRQHLTEVVAEVVSKYDIDAIHFDDYFYPYKVQGQEFPDSLDFRIYGAGYSTIEDWRRSNVDALIEMVASRIKTIKPFVQLGISPFGVWRNKDRDPEGSDTRAGATCYDDLYADVRKWLRLGWIDYVVPQLYWNIGFAPADHETLVNWWSRNSYGRQLYIGHAAYKVGNNPEPAWYDPKEIPTQIELNRLNWLTQGSVYFSSNSLLENPLGLMDSLEQYYRYTALIPEFFSPTSKSPAPPNFRKVGKRKEAVKVKWKLNKTERESPPAYYIIYRFDADGPVDFTDPRNILARTSLNVSKKCFRYFDDRSQPGKKYIYTVSAASREHMESNPSPPKTILKTETGVRKIKS